MIRIAIIRVIGSYIKKWLTSFIATIKKSSLWLLWDFSGMHAIWQKISPQKNHGKDAPTFLLWLVSIYIALYGISSQLYQNRISVLENSLNATLSIMQVGDRKLGYSRLAEVQNMKTPEDPIFLRPTTVFKSLICSWNNNLRMVETIKKIYENSKNDLNHISCQYADLTNLNIGGGSSLPQSCK